MITMKEHTLAMCTLVKDYQQEHNLSFDETRDILACVLGAIVQATDSHPEWLQIRPHARA